MRTYDELNKLLFKEQWLPAARFKARRKADVAIAEIKLGKAFTLGRVMHSDRAGDYMNMEQVELRYMGVPFATWGRSTNSVFIDFAKLEADGRFDTADFNKCVDKLRTFIPEFWFARATGGKWNRHDPVWVVAEPSISHGGGTYKGQAHVCLNGAAFIEAKRTYNSTAGKYDPRGATLHGAVSDQIVYGYNWQKRESFKHAFQRIRTNERAKARKVERQYLAAMYAWNIGCGAREWAAKQRNDKAAHLAELQRTAVARWLKANGRTTYKRFGVEYVDLFKGTVRARRTDDTFSDYMSQHYNVARVEYLPGSTPYDPHFSPHNGCGGGLHMCAKEAAVHNYVRPCARVVVCPVRVEDIILIGYHGNEWDRVESLDKVKVREVALPIKEVKDVIL